MNDQRSSPDTAVLDKDLAEQARAGHGVPSQDPDPAAQQVISPEEAEREGKSVLAGGGFVGGAAVGASIGAAVGGPIGVVVGGTLGAVAGTMGAAAAGAELNPSAVQAADAEAYAASVQRRVDAGERD